MRNLFRVVTVLTVVLVCFACVGSVSAQGMGAASQAAICPPAQGGSVADLACCPNAQNQARVNAPAPAASSAPGSASASASAGGGGRVQIAENNDVTPQGGTFALVPVNPQNLQTVNFQASNNVNGNASASAASSGGGTVGLAAAPACARRTPVRTAFANFHARRAAAHAARASNLGTPVAFSAPGNGGSAAAAASTN